MITAILTLAAYVAAFTVAALAARRFYLHGYYIGLATITEDSTYATEAWDHALAGVFLAALAAAGVLILRVLA